MAFKGPDRAEGKKLYNRRANARELAVMDEFACQAITLTWDFAVDGGAAGSAIASGTYLPANCLVTRVSTYEATAVTGATDCDVLVGATELVSAINFTGDAGLQSRTVANPLVSSRSELKIIFNTAAATAGKVHFVIEYVKLDD